MGIGFHRSRRQIGGALLKESERAHKSACRNASFIIEDPTNVPRLRASSQSRENYLVWSSFLMWRSLCQMKSNCRRQQRNNLSRVPHVWVHLMQTHNFCGSIFHESFLFILQKWDSVVVVKLLRQRRRQTSSFVYCGAEKADEFREDCFKLWALIQSQLVPSVESGVDCLICSVIHQI